MTRSGYSNAPQSQLDRMVAMVQARHPALLVLGAWVDQAAPSLPEALSACAAAGAQRVLVLPIFLPTDANLHTWLAKVIRRWQEGHTSVAVTLGESLVETPALAEALNQAVAQASTAPDLRESPPTNWEHDPAGWSHIPAHQQHVLLCRGPRCNALGAGALAAHLAGCLTAHGLRGGDERVLVAQTGCLYPCNLGPVLVVYPAGVWYGGLDEAAISQIVTQHFIDGEVVEAHARLVPAPDTTRSPA
ncbi:MAG: hypothetical protein MUD01_13865 [Chloroflexaceae bacterium]|nr:hypothetical protein [Chloroflexaceae bacterium]